MPNNLFRQPAESLPALCRVIRLRFALLLLRTANRCSDRARRIIERYEGEE